MVIYNLMTSIGTALGIEFFYVKVKEKKWVTVVLTCLAIVCGLTFFGMIQQNVFEIYSDRFTDRELLAVGFFLNGNDDKLNLLLFTLIRSLLFSSVIGLAISNDNNRYGRVEAERKLQKLEQQNLESQIGQLRNQMSPHFLFNAFATLSSMTSETNAKRFISRLSDVYRYLLTNREYQEQKLVTLDKEAEFTRAYIYILQERFEDALQVNCTISDTAKQKKIPPFALQVLIENATKHNVISERQPLTINVRTQEDKWLEVSNNLQPKNTTSEGFGVGLGNVNERYKLIAKKEIDCEQTDKEFIVRLPLL